MLLGALAGTGVVVLAIWLTLGRQQSPQHLAVVIGLFIQASGSIGLLVQASVELAEKRRSLVRYLAFINATPDPVSEPATGARRSGLGADHVTFTYPSARQPALLDVTCTFVPATLNVVVGPNGGGKSSLVKVLTGLHQPESGTVSMASVDDRTVLHEDFAHFPLTVRENLDTDEPRTDDELWTGLTKVGLDQTIRATPAGLDTPLYRDSTARASDLSGGQWQRLTIARTLPRAQKTSIAILDEPTSALDAFGEADVLDLLIREPTGSTIVLVTHRLQWAKQAASVTEITGPDRCRTATHKHLLEHSDWYRTAYTRQSKAFN